MIRMVQKEVKNIFDEIEKRNENDSVKNSSKKIKFTNNFNELDGHGRLKQEDLELYIYWKGDVNNLGLSHLIFRYFQSILDTEYGDTVIILNPAITNGEVIWVNRKDSTKIYSSVDVIDLFFSEFANLAKKQLVST